MNLFETFATTLAPLTQSIRPEFVIPLIAVGIFVLISPYVGRNKLGLIRSRAGLGLTLVTAAQMILLLGFAAQYAPIVATGREIQLPFRPIDPYDMFRGNYLTLAYEISRINLLATPNHAAKPFRLNDDVYVVMAQNQDRWNPAYISDRLPALVNGQIALKGRVKRADDLGLDVYYGIEQYYYQERKTPRDLRGACAKLKVAKDGKAVLTGIALKTNELSIH